MSETDSDRELSRAWRDASREEPPSALDDAIRAAARREVGAGPKRRPTPAWWPLAAAAAVAVVAIGIVQMTPPERVSPEASVSDVPPTAATGQAAPTAPTALKKDLPAPPAPIAERDQATPPPAPQAAFKPAPDTAAGEERSAGPRKERASTALSAGLARNVAPPVPARAKEAPESASREAASRSAERYAAGGATQERKRETGSSMSEPFPAASPAPAPATSSTGAGAPPPAPADALRESPTAPGASAERRAPLPLPSPLPPERQLQRPLSARGDFEQQAANKLAVKEKAAAADRHLRGRDEGVGAAAGSVAQAPADKPQAKLAATPGEVAQSSANAADATAARPLRPAAEWIALIRKLKQEGRVEEAAKELAAFRRDYRERADALLPPDLRERPP